MRSATMREFFFVFELDVLDFHRPTYNASANKSSVGSGAAFALSNRLVEACRATARLERKKRGCGNDALVRTRAHRCTATNKTNSPS